MRFSDLLMVAATQGGGAPVYDPLAVTYFANVVSAGGTVSTARKALVSALIAGIRADGDLPSLDNLLLLCAEDSQGALVDVIAGRTATAVNSPTFTANQGYAGNGSTSYVNTNFNPATQGTAFTLNSCHMMIYDRTARTAVSTAWNCGNGDNVTTNLHLGVRKSGSTISLMNCVTTNSYTPPSNSQGIFIANRSTSLATQTYWAGSSLGANAADPSVSIASQTIFIGGANDTALSGPITDQHGLFAAGGSLSSAAALRMTNRYQTFLTAVGA